MDYTPTHSPLAQQAPIRRPSPNGRRLTAWIIIFALASVAAGLVATTGAFSSATSSTLQPSLAETTGPPIGGSIPLAPGTGDSSGGNSVAPSDTAPSTDPNVGLSDLGASLGGGATHRESSYFVGYTVPAGSVLSSDSDVQLKIRNAGGTILNNTTANNGGNTVVHAEVTFVFPQGNVDQFLGGFGGDFQPYGNQQSSLDRSANYIAASTQQISDTGKLAMLVAQRKTAVANSTDATALDSSIKQLTITTADRQQAIDHADQAPLSRVTLLLDDRLPVQPTGLQSAWLLGTHNVLGVAIAVTFIGITASPLLVLLVPLWMAWRRISRRITRRSAPA